MLIALKKTEKGFSLLVIAVIVVLLGICIQYGVGLFKVETETERELKTEKRVARLVAQIASYTQQYDRLPCPADPAAGNPAQLAFGAEDRSGALNSCAQTEGIVPFRTLNIEPEEAVDSWGRYLTYAVSPVFSNTDVDATTVSYQCRNANWIDQVKIANRDPIKARFCCPPAATYPNTTDILITGEPALTRNTTPANINTSSVLDAVVHGVSVDTWAMALVSHGRNGYGAYIGNGTNGKNLTPAHGTAETENANGDRTFQTAARNYVPGNNYFDDIIVYRTQSQLYSQLSSGTCIIP